LSDAPWTWDDYFGLNKTKVRFLFKIFENHPSKSYDFSTQREALSMKNLVLWLRKKLAKDYALSWGCPFTCKTSKQSHNKARP
jgi:hypothetical protein